MYVVQVHILDDAQGGRGWLQNTSPWEMVVEESPLGPSSEETPIAKLEIGEENSL